MEDMHEKIFPATVAKVIDDYTVVINRGSIHGVKDGMKFLIYGDGGEEIIDPVSEKSLGNLEIVKGTGKVILVQEKISTIKSTDKTAPKKEIINTSNISPIGLLNNPFLTPKNKEVLIPGKRKPFNKPKILDKAKPV